MGKTIYKLSITYIAIIVIVYITFLLTQLVPSTFIWIIGDIKNIINAFIAFIIGITYSAIVNHILMSKTNYKLIMLVNGMLEIIISILIAYLMLNINEIQVEFIIFYARTTILIGLILIVITFYIACLKKLLNKKD